MALSVGTITINTETGAHSGSGWAYDMLDAWWSAKDADYADASVETVVAVKQGMTSLLESIASGSVDAITGDAVVGRSASLSPWGPGSIAAASSTTAPVSLTGIEVGEPAMVSITTSGGAALPAGLLADWYCTTAGQLTVRLYNATAAAINPGLLTVKARTARVVS